MPIKHSFNTKQVSREIKEAVEQVEYFPTQVIRNYVFNLIEYMVKISPVGDYDVYKKYYDANFPGKSPENYEPGWFISNWHVSFKGGKEDPRPNSGPGLGELVSIYEAQNKMKSFRLGRDSSITITNPVPYAGLIENGHSPIAPEGILQPTLQEKDVLLQQAIQDTRANPKSK